MDEKLSRLLSGYDEGLESDNYEVEPEELVKLLNDWRNRYTGLTSEIIIGTRLDKQISMTVYFLGIALAIAVIVMLALFTNVFK